MQIFADVFNLPARRNAIGRFGPAPGQRDNTAVGLGLYPDYGTWLSSNMVR